MTIAGQKNFNRMGHELSVKMQSFHATACQKNEHPEKQSMSCIHVGAQATHPNANLMVCQCQGIWTKVPEYVHM